MYHPDFTLPVTYSAEVVGDDPDEQVTRTVELMSQYAREDLNDPLLLSAAGKLRGKTQPETANNVWAFVRGLMKFQEDHETASRGRGLSSLGHPVIEVLIRPRDVLEIHASGRRQAGDCDDFSMLTAALMEANGVRCNFVTAAHEPGQERFSHIYVAAYVDGERLVMDTSHGENLGGEHPSHRIQEWPVSSNPGCLVLIAIAVVFAYYFMTEEDGGER